MQPPQRRRGRIEKRKHMKIICQSCQSKYNVADEKVQGKTVKIRCRKCGATIVVSGNGASAEPSGAGQAGPGPAMTGADGDGQYHVNVSDGDQRTMTIAEIVQAYNEGAVNQETYLWTDGMDDWLPLAQVDAIVAALNSAALPPAPAPTGGPDAPTVETRAAVVAAAAAAAPIAAQPEAKRAAVVRREGRANRDLFGGGGGGDMAAAQDVQTSAPMFATGAAVPAGAGGATGQRNENSVLFSLAALTSMAAQPQTSPGGATTKDDSGLIDLKAMTAAAATAPKRISEAPAAPLFPVASPFGVEQPILASPADAPPTKNRLPLFIGLGAGAFAVLAAIGIVIIVKLSATKPVEIIQVPATVSAPTMASAPAPDDTSSAASTASPPATASPSASVAKSTAAATRPRPGAPARPGAAPASPGAAPPPAATKPPAVHTGSCGCSGDDLMCQIKCAAGKH
jgi:predicted Zn finger-like uncharacterized protein